MSSPLPCISLYADDASLVVSLIRSIKEVFSVFSRYERGSGAKLNLAKCKGLRLGPWNGCTDSPVDIEWLSDKIKILGVFVGLGDLDECNWRPRITAVEHVLSSWRQRSLFYSGKSLIINSVTIKSAYLFLLSELSDTPHCVAKFRPLFGRLYWPSTWRQLFLFGLDRPVIDLCWKVSYGVLFTAERLVSLGYSVPLACFCSAPCESLRHLFFDCPLAQSVLSWLQSLLFCSSPLSPSIALRHVLFGFSPDELRAVPFAFVYLLNIAKFCIWWARNDFRFRNVPPSAIDVIARVKLRFRFYLPLFFRRFRSVRRRRFFVRQWGARGYVASIVNSKLVVKI